MIPGVPFSLDTLALPVLLVRRDAVTTRWDSHGTMQSRTFSVGAVPFPICFTVVARVPAIILRLNSGLEFMDISQIDIKVGGHKAQGTAKRPKRMVSYSILAQRSLSRE